MTIKLHLSASANPSQFDDQARQLLTRLTPPAPVWQVLSLEQAFTLAQYLDLVDAGYGPRTALYRCTRAAVQRFVHTNWRQPSAAATFARSPCLALMAQQAFDAYEQSRTAATESSFELPGWRPSSNNSLL